MTTRAEEIRDFYDSTRAAEAAAKWPLLERIWLGLGGEQASQSGGTKLHVPPAPMAEIAPSPGEPGVLAQRSAEASAPAPQESPTLEDLFGRLR